VYLYLLSMIYFGVDGVRLQRRSTLISFVVPGLPIARRLSLGQLKVMTAIENCRAAALGGSFSTVKPSQHLLTAIDIARRFTG
jgi:hypothetical protein